MREPTKEQGPVSMAALMRFERTSNEMTGVTVWVDPEQIPVWSDMAELWVQGKEVTTRVDYSQVPQNETLAVNAEGMGSATNSFTSMPKTPAKRSPSIGSGIPVGPPGCWMARTAGP